MVTWITGDYTGHEGRELVFREEGAGGRDELRVQTFDPQAWADFTLGGVYTIMGPDATTAIASALAPTAPPI